MPDIDSSGPHRQADHYIWGRARSRVVEQLTSRQILDRLVSFPTVSRGSNLALVDWLEDYLTGQGIRCFGHWN